MKNHKPLFILLLFAAAMLFTACKATDDETDPGQGIRIYCTDRLGSQLLYETYYPEETEKDRLVTELLQRLDGSPADVNYRSVKPKDVFVDSFSFGADGQLILDFSSSYLKMTGIDEVLTRAAIVKTLCQIPGVEYVEFSVGGIPLILRGDTPVGEMTASDFIDTTGGMSRVIQNTRLTLFYAERDADLMQELIINIENSGNKTMEQLAVEALIQGPPTEEAEFVGVMPEGTVLNKIVTRDGICYVDFNESFIEPRDGVSDEIAVYCLVNSLCDLPHINKVQITVNGEKRSFINAYKLPESLERRPELISNEKAGDISAGN